VRAYRYKLEAYWSGRGQMLIPEAARLANFLSDATSIDEKSSAWFIAKDDELLPLEPASQVEQLASALSGRVKTWLYGSRTFSGGDLLVTNGRTRPTSVKVTLSCATESSTVGVWFPSSVVVDLFCPRSGLDTREKLYTLFEAACRQFEPEWACLGDPDFPVQGLEERLTGVPKASFLTYVSDRYPLPQALPAPMNVRRIAGARGGYVVAKDDWFDGRLPSDQASVESVETALRDAGALVPATAPVPE